MDDIVERVKQANRIEDVIEEGGYALQRRGGKYLRAREHDSLVINTRNQTYSWNSQGEIQEDVIGWLMHRNNWDFKAAVEWLCRRARLAEPKWSQEDQGMREARRKRESVFGLAQRAMQRWLWADKEALAYCRGRGWTDETIWEAGLGFSGRGTAAALKDLRGDLSLHEIDPECPEAAAILGYHGDAGKWGKKWGVNVTEEHPNWVENKYIPGLVGRTRLIYPHFESGRVVYFSARNFLGAETTKDGREIKSYNLPVLLGGERRPYFNHHYGARAEECVIVEGQADAVTLAQWEIPAVALIGTAWQDKEPLLTELRKRHERLYIGMDADKAGETALRGRNNDWPVAFIVGPMCRVARWEESEANDGSQGKDANDWLRWGMAREGLTDYGGEIGKITTELSEDVQDLFIKAQGLIRTEGRVTISWLQRQLHIGYPRATRVMEALAEAGVVGEADGAGGRLVLKGIEAEEDEGAETGEGEKDSGEGEAGQDLSGQIPEDMEGKTRLGQTPEDMSGRTPEDMNGRTHINMSGRTRRSAPTAENEGGAGGEAGEASLAELSDEELRRLAAMGDAHADEKEASAEGAVEEAQDEEEAQGLVEAEEAQEGPAEGMDEERKRHIQRLVERQARKARALLNSSLTMAEEVAVWAGSIQGPEKDGAFKTAFALFTQMERIERAQYRGSLVGKLGIGIREFDGILKAAGKEMEERPMDIAEILGGFVNGWLIEYIYDPVNDQARLAYRDPDGKIGTAEFIDIEGIRYVPRRVTGFVRDGGVLFPSTIGVQKSTRELVAIVEMFINQHYLLENKYLSRIIAYYVMLTWVYDAFNALPYLRAMGEPGAGKSELMRRVGMLCYRMMAASGANTAASFFRATETYRGTVFIDEADLHDGGDMSNDLVKFLNLGAMKGNPIWRLEEVMTENGRNYEVATFSTFCPKLIAMRKDFRDDAVGSRSLTIKLMPREPIELKSRGIRLYIDDEFRDKARAIRNMLLRWRFMIWQPEIEVTEEHMDLDVSSRLNQVTMPLKALAKDDPGLQDEIVKFLREYNREMVLTRSMTLAARIVEALWRIHNSEEMRGKYIIAAVDGQGEAMMIGDVAKVANKIIDEMNAMEDETEEEEDSSSKRKRKKDSLTARGVGSIIRNELQLHVGDRRGKGFPVFWDDVKMDALARRYGIDPEEKWEVVDVALTPGPSPDRVSPDSGEGKQGELEI